MTVETVKQIGEMAKKLADQKAAGLLPSEADRQELIALIDAEEAGMKTAEAERAARARAQEQARMLRRGIDQARLEIEAASRRVIDAMTYFMLFEFSPGPSLPDSALGRAENLETALAAQLAVIDAITGRATELKSSLKSGWTVLT